MMIIHWVLGHPILKQTQKRHSGTGLNLMVCCSTAQSLTLTEIQNGYIYMYIYIYLHMLQTHLIQRLKIEVYGCHQSRIGSQDTNTLKASCRPSALYKSTLPRISLSAMSASFRRKWVSSTLAYMFEITNPKCSLTIYDPSSRSGVSSLTTGNSWNQLFGLDFH